VEVVSKVGFYGKFGFTNFGEIDKYRHHSISGFLHIS
jgi:hypothetical protein